MYVYHGNVVYDNLSLAMWEGRQGDWKGVHNLLSLWYVYKGNVVHDLLSLARWQVYQGTVVGIPHLRVDVVLQDT